MNEQRPVTAEPIVTMDIPTPPGENKSEAKRETTSEKNAVRRIAMLLVPAVVLIVGGVLYLWGGRYVGTDNAYIKADIASLSPEISGAVTEVLVAENQKVTKGQALITLDDTKYRIGLAEAAAELRSAIATVESDRALYRQKVQSLAMAQTDVSFADRELKRQSSLAASNFVAASKLDEARHTSDSAQQKIGLLKQEQAEILTKLQGNPDLPVEQHPSYQSAKAKEAAADYFIHNATLTAPFDGVVSRLPKVGDYARSGAPLMSVVSSKVMWIDANFKETELTYMRPGQPVAIHVDTYPGRTFKGHLESIAQASGGEFSLLPAQNSTGNWVKVVQRIPVRIAIDENPTDGAILRAGMSVNADVDTGRNRLSRLFGG